MNPIGLFKTQLEQQGITPREYLNTARAFAYHSGHYEPDKLYFSTDDVHKLEYRLPTKTIKIGKSGYGDYIIYSHIERQSERKGIAETKRKQYLARARKISGDWKSNKFSPNRLAMRILWSDSL